MSGRSDEGNRCGEGGRGEEEGGTGTFVDVASRATEELTRISRAFFFAGRESMSGEANPARSFITKLSNVSEEAGVPISRRMRNLPGDVAQALVHSLHKSNELPGSFIDKFYEKYKEA